VDSKNRVERTLSQAAVTTRDKILAAAAAILAEDGIIGISTRRVADRAGVNQALVHYHFGSIENLLLEVLRGTSARAMLMLRARYPGSKDFVDEWVADLETIFDEEAYSPKSWLGIMGVVVNHDNLMETYRKEFADPNYEIMKTAALQSLPRDGEAQEAEAEAIASFALIVKAGLFFTSLLGRNPGEEKALELAAKFLRQHVESIPVEDHSPRRAARLARSE
jgi:AcrR family transcriptional regulator